MRVYHEVINDGAHPRKFAGDLLGSAYLLCDGGAGFDHCDVSSMVKVLNCEN